MSNSMINALNTRMRLTGMSSGLDTDSIVKKLMSVDYARLDKLKQQKEKTEWKMDAYREVTNMLRSFHNDYLDILSPKNIKSLSSFSTFVTSYGTSTDSNYVGITAGSSAKAGTYTISSITAATAATLSGTNVSKPVVGLEITNNDIQQINSANNNNVIRFTYNNTTVNLTIEDSENITTVDGMVAALQAKINKNFGAGNITVGSVDGTNGGKQLTFTNARSTDSFSMDVNQYLGINLSNNSNKIDITAKIADKSAGFVSPLGITQGDITDNDIEFTINGEAFSFNSANTSIQDIMNSINNNKNVNATLRYDFTTNSFKLQGKTTGATSELNIVDKTGKFMKSILNNNLSDTGNDAIIKIDGVADPIVRSTNSFTYDGLNFNIQKDLVEGVDTPVTVTVKADASAAYDKIKGFVDKYNELIDKIGSKLSEKKYREYNPLTEEQKSGMSEAQIKQWEDKAKSGLLNGDSIISGLMTKLRESLYTSVEGVGAKLYTIGITTSIDYSSKGKLVIDETKLKDALVNNPDEVANLFAKSSDINYYQATESDTADLKNQRYNESGLAQRFSDIIQDSIRTTTIKDSKGSLLEKAGMLGDSSVTKNMLFKEISGFDKAVSEMNYKLTAKENALYSKFAQLESALNRMNSQSSWLSQQFGGSQ